MITCLTDIFGSVSRASLPPCLLFYGRANISNTAESCDWDIHGGLVEGELAPAPPNLAASWLCMDGEFVNKQPQFFKTTICIKISNKKKLFYK